MPRTEPFDKFPAEYEAWFERHRFVYLSELEAVRHFIPKGKKGIEVGIGTGRFALPLGIEFGIEPSTSMRDFATRMGLDVRDGVAEKIPVPDQSFDFALMVTTVCFIDDPLKSFDEVRRIVKPKGLFVIGLVDKHSALGRTYEAFKSENKFYRIATFYSPNEVIDYLGKTGFNDIKVVQTVFGKLESINAVQPFKPGYGEGAFVVICSTRSA